MQDPRLDTSASRQLHQVQPAGIGADREVVQRYQISVGSAVLGQDVGKPGAGEPYARFDGRELETELNRYRASSLPYS